MAIEGDGWFEQQFTQLLVQGEVSADQLPIFVKRLVGGTDNDNAVETIQERVLASFLLAAGILQANDGRNAQRPCHDGCVRSLAADIGGKPKDITLIQLRGV